MTIPKKKKCRKAKWLSEEALKIAEKRREAKGKWKKEKIYPFACRFQRIAQRDKKAFLSEQCKGKEENNRMGKTRDLIKKIKFVTVSIVSPSICHEVMGLDALILFF